MMLLIELGVIIEFIIHGIESGLVALVLVIFFGMVVTQQAKILNKILSFKLFVQFGTISYSLYLLHQNIGYILLRAFYENNFSSLAAIPLTIFISIVLATGLNLLIEKPANTRIRAFWQAQKEKLRS
jgi:peptidoglycan/LPS O-acetylase OafA/YrhL